MLTVEAPHGPVLVSADLHGHGEDFRALRRLWEASRARGEDPVWISVGDWVHGPNAAEPSPIRGGDDLLLYDYPDESATIVRELMALQAAHPTRVLSILGNHEQAHIGGPRTSKFHRDEAAVLEAQLSSAEIAAWHATLHRWPLLIGVPRHGLVITHGALSPPVGARLADLQAAESALASGERVSGAALEILRSGMTAYGYVDGGDERLLALCGPPYHTVVHGHDREELGWASSGARAFLLCTSFGARHGHKTYLWLDGQTPIADCRRFLWPASAW